MRGRLIMVRCRIRAEWPAWQTRALTMRASLTANRESGSHNGAKAPESAPSGMQGARSAPAPIGRHQAGIGPKTLTTIPRRHLQRPQDGDGSQREARFHHRRIHIPSTRDAARQAATKPIMAFDSASHILAMQKGCEPRGCCRPAVAPQIIAATNFSPRRGGDAGKADDAIPKTQGFAIKDAYLRRLSCDGTIRGSRAEKIGRQAKTKEKRGNHRACNSEPRTANAGAELPSFENPSWFTHE